MEGLLKEMESEIGFQVRNKASVLMSLILFLRNILSTIMDKSPMDSQNVTSILCVSQVMSQKAVLSFYKYISPSPSPPNTMLKDQMNCALTVSALSVG